MLASRLPHVHSLSPEVDRDFGHVALHCGNVADDDMVRHGHGPYDLGSADHDNVTIIVFLHVLQVLFHLPYMSSLVEHD